MLTGVTDEQMVSLEAQLNASVRLQIEGIREGINRLGASQDRLRGMRAALGRATELCKTSAGLVDGYDRVRVVSRTCENFRLVASVFKQFTELDARVSRTAELLEADVEGERTDNLLLIYFHLSHLEAFRCRTMTLMGDAPQAVQYTLRRYFKKLDDLSACFDSHFWSQPRTFLTLTEGDNRRFEVARWAMVMGRMGGSARSRLTTILDDQIGGRFREAVQAEDVEGSLHGMDFWLGELTFLRDMIVPCFPPEMCLMDWLALTYHRHIHARLQATLAKPSQLHAGDILFLLRWTRDYHDRTASELSFGPDDLEPPLLAPPDESRLIQAYCREAGEKAAGWIANLYENHRREMVERRGEPGVDGTDCYLSEGAVDLMQMIRAHVTAAGESGNGRLLLGVIDDTVRLVSSLQSRLGTLLATETTAFLSAPDRVAPHCEAHLLMLGNTGLTWATSLQSEIVSGLDALVPAEYLGAASKHFKSLTDGFVQMGKGAAGALCQIIFAALRPAISQLFTPAWYTGETPIMETILVTFGDFFADYKLHAQDFLYGNLVAVSLETLLLAYLAQLPAKTTRISPLEAQQLFEADCKSITAFFSEHRDPRRVQKAVDAVQKFTSLLASSQKMVYLEFFAVWKAYPDMSMALFADSLARRDDLDRQATKDILATCSKKIQEERPLESPPSLLSRVQYKQ